MGEQILSVKHLSVQYKTDLETVYAVRNVSFSLNRGEVIGLAGETGAGKTTVALSIMNLLPARVGQITSGSIAVDNVDVLTAKDADLRKMRGSKVSMVFQDPMTSLNPVLTVGRQIAEVIELHEQHASQANVEDRVDEILKMVGIQPQRKNEYGCVKG